MDTRVRYKCQVLHQGLPQALTQHTDILKYLSKYATLSYVWGAAEFQKQKQQGGTAGALEETKACRSIVDAKKARAACQNE